MLVQYIRYRIDVAHRHNFVEAFALITKQLDTHPACLAYDLKECLDDPSLFMLRVEWNPNEGRFTFRPSAFFPDLIGNGAPFPDQVTENHCYRPTGINKRK
jgi:hypothetical protein